MGDIFSTKKNTTNNTTENHQVALQGRGQVGISSSQVYGDVSVNTSDPEVIQSALQTVSDAIEIAGRSTQQNAVIAAAAIDSSRENSSRALDVANTSLLASGAALVRTLDFLSVSQDRSLKTVDDAVSAAQSTALLATPQSPAAYAEIQKGQDSKPIIFGFVALAGLIGFAAYSSKHA